MPEQDLVTLGIKISKDPETYKEEYFEQLRALETIMSLPNPSSKQVSPLVSFVVRHANISPEKSLSLLKVALESATESRTVRTILDGLIIMRQKKLVESHELVRLIVKYGHELSYFVKRTQEFLDVECYGVIREWYLKGTEKQKKFCYFLLLVLFSKIHEVSDRLLSNNEAGLEADSEASSSIDTDVEVSSELEVDTDVESSSELEVDTDMEVSSSTDHIRMAGIERENVRYNNKSKIIDTEELEKLICEAFFIGGSLEKTACLYFLNRTEVRFDISKVRKGKEYGERIYKQLLKEIMDRDIKIMKMKIFVLFKKAFHIDRSLLKMAMNMLDVDKNDSKEILECAIASVDESEAIDAVRAVCEQLVREGERDETVVLGMNILREIYKISSEEEVKEAILKGIESFKGNRTRSIFYAYKMIIKVVVEGEEVEAGVAEVKKKKQDKVERALVRKRGRDEIKRLKMEAKREEKHEKYKNKRKGRKRDVMTKRLMKK